MVHGSILRTMHDAQQPLSFGEEGTPERATATEHNAPEAARESDQADDPTMPSGLMRGSRIAILRALPRGRRWTYFREQLLARCLAVMAAAAIVVYLGIQILAPAAPPQLYVAVANGALSAERIQSLQGASARYLNLPVGRKGGLAIDSRFDLTADGLSKLQTMIGNRGVDLVIAPPAAFRQLAGYGYFTPLPERLSPQQRDRLSRYFVTARGYDDTDHDDAFYDGSGKGASQPYGLDASGADPLIRKGAQAPNLVLAVVANGRNPAHANRFISYLMNGR